MIIKKKCTVFELYGPYKKQQRKLFDMPFKFLCLCLYIIGFYYFFLNISLESNSLEIFEINNVYKRNLGEVDKYNKESEKKRNLKRKKEDVNKTKQNKNKINSNEQKVHKNRCSINDDLKNKNIKNLSNSSTNNINYNDMSKNLTEMELLDVLNSLEECPPKEDLRNIWTHTVGVVKEGVFDIEKELKVLIQKYLDNDIYEGTVNNTVKSYVYKSIWDKNISRLYETLGTEEILYTNNFFSLIKGKHSLDDILKFIYSFLEHFKTLKKELHQKHQKELLESIAQNLRLLKKKIL